ncbi:MAG: hypothetical protein AAGF12_39435, partial [Myxococcota bacterium]
LMVACGDAGGGPNAGADLTLEEVNAEFPFTPNEPMQVHFVCLVANSGLEYELLLRSSSSFSIAARLDTGDVASATGRYSYENDVISLRTDPNNFIYLDERTTTITPALGIVYAFASENMRCVAVGHEHNDGAIVGEGYLCPEFSEGAASSQVNAFEFDVAFPGSIFRDRNRWVLDRGQPSIQRGYGIYRRVGNRYYGYFGTQFDDYNLVTGTFSPGGEAVEVEQLPDGSPPCSRR